MTIFKQKDNKCYFIHIPRTAGRYVHSIFSSSKNVEYYEPENPVTQGILTVHLHYPLYEYYLNTSDIPHITIVRDPFTKFESCIRCMNFYHSIDYNQVLINEEEFLKFINLEIEILSSNNNWFLPQYKFFSPKTFFWKYEWGFGENFVDWVYEKTKIKLNKNLKDLKYSDLSCGEVKKPYNYFLDKRIQDYVKNFYKKDYELFGYE